MTAMAIALQVTDPAAVPWYKNPEWWVVGVALLTLLVLYYQARQMRAATEAMEKSTGVMMGVERGRIMTYWNQVIHIDMSPAGEHEGQLSHRFNWACANIGRTQAELTQTWARFIVISSLTDLPQKPDYSAANERTYRDDPLRPNADKIQTNWFSTPLETTLGFDEIQERHRVKRDCVLYAYGYAKYLDVWGIQRETRFGVVRVPQDSITLDTWVVAGPPEYNKST